MNEMNDAQRKLIDFCRSGAPLITKEPFDYLGALLGLAALLAILFLLGSALVDALQHFFGFQPLPFLRSLFQRL